LVPESERDEFDAIVKLAQQADPGGHGVNRVGALYLRLIDLFRRLDPQDFRTDPDTVARQGTPPFWNGKAIPAGTPAGVLVGVVGSQADAVAALTAIARQGEGLAGD